MAYSVLKTNKIMATNVDSLVRDGVSAATVMENGFIVNLLTKSTTAGEGEVFAATQPVTGALLGLYMVNEPVVVSVTSADGVVYKGINPDPRNFSIAPLTPFTTFKPMPGDIIELTADGFTGARSSNTFANAADQTDQLVWGSSQTASALSFKYLGDSYVSIGSGTLGATQRVVTYVLQCLAN